MNNIVAVAGWNAERGLRGEKRLTLADHDAVVRAAYEESKRGAKQRLLRTPDRKLSQAIQTYAALKPQSPSTGAKPEGGELSSKWMRAGVRWDGSAWRIQGG